MHKIGAENGDGLIILHGYIIRIIRYYLGPEVYFAPSSEIPGGDGLYNSSSGGYPMSNIL